MSNALIVRIIDASLDCIVCYIAGMSKTVCQAIPYEDIIIFTDMGFAAGKIVRHTNQKLI